MVTDKRPDEIINDKDIKNILKSVNAAALRERNPGALLWRISEAVAQAAECEHVFISLYDKTGQVFRAAAWQSSIQPGEASLERKFMGERYVAGEPVIINDLTQYNYRLKPDAARMQLKSMIGVPVISEGGIWGVMELYSQQPSRFSDLDVELLSIFAKLAAGELERFEQNSEIRYLMAENDFKSFLISNETSAVTQILYKFGEILFSVLGAAGIVVFELDPASVNKEPREVLVENFAERSIAAMKNVLAGPMLQKLAAVGEGSEESRVLRQSPGTGEAGEEELFYIPVAWRQSLYGLVVCSWKQQTISQNDFSRLCRFVKSAADQVGVVMLRRIQHASIQRISLLDPLTKVATRRLFDYALEQEFKKVRHTGRPLSLLLLEVDDFKDMNDQFGHVSGDAILEQIGVLLQNQFRSSDIVARYSGLEFSVILPETSRDEAVHKAENLRSQVEHNSFFLGNDTLKLTISIGVVCYDGKISTGINTADYLMLAADQTLCQAKKLGKNLAMVWSGN